MIRVGWKYTAKFVKHRTTSQGTPLTECQIGCKVKDGVDAQGKPLYWNVRLTIWKGLNISDGDTLVLDGIAGIEPRMYDGKMYYDAVVTAHTEAGDRPAKPPVSDDDISLPFSLEDLDP